MTNYEHEEQFVSRMIAALLQRHSDKLAEIVIPLNDEDIIRTSGRQHLVDVQAEVDALKKVADNAIAVYEEVADHYREKYGEEAKELISKAHLARRQELKTIKDKFEFKLRNASSLVALVSSREAYDVLQECRIEIRDMKM